jgi:dihydrofolate synthase/folylpolyglutamate synthase
MFDRVGPLVDRWYFCDLPTPRAETADGLRLRWEKAAKKDVPVSTHADPEQALRAAAAAAGPADRILVFGSFYTVGGVLKNGVPRLQARHLAA